MDDTNQVEVTEETKQVKTTRRASTTKMIKVKALRDFLNHEGNIILAGQEVEVPQDLAAMLAMPIMGPYDFSGYRPESCASVAKIIRAERLPN